MLIALLTVDAVLKKSLLRNIQRRGPVPDSSEASNTGLHHPRQLFNCKRVKLFTGFPNNLNIMSATIGQQQGSVAATVTSIPKTMLTNIDNTLNNNAAIM